LWPRVYERVAVLALLAIKNVDNGRTMYLKREDCRRRRILGGPISKLLTLCPGHKTYEKSNHNHGVGIAFRYNEHRRRCNTPSNYCPVSSLALLRRESSPFYKGARSDLPADRQASKAPCASSCCDARSRETESIVQTWIVARSAVFGCIKS